MPGAGPTRYRHAEARQGGHGVEAIKRLESTTFFLSFFLAPEVRWLFVTVRALHVDGSCVTPLTPPSPLAASTSDFGATPLTPSVDPPDPPWSHIE